MKKLYFDCSNGISGDMALGALVELGADKGTLDQAVKGLNLDNHADSQGHRTHKKIREIISTGQLTQEVKDTALSIYKVIAAGEAKVHEADIEHVHFHEVGRDQAIANIVGVAAALNDLHVDEIYCSAIHDGKGFIDCSHGRIPVPVPAVMAMRESCEYEFVTEDVPTEMVTPSGLGMLIGMGAQYLKEFPSGRIVCATEVKGKRDTGRGGLKASLIQEGEQS